MPTTVVGLFDQFPQARDAVRDLVEGGFARENISLIANDVSGQYARDLEGVNVNDTGAATGAGVGAVLGGITGLLVGLSALAVPGIGPILAAGPILATLGGAGVGAVTGGIIGALTNAGVSEEEANIYAEGVRRGGTLVTVDTTDEMANRAADIINRHNPVDIHARAADWRANRWKRFDENAQPYRNINRPRQSAVTNQPRVRGVQIYTGPTESDYVGRPGQMGFLTYEPRFREHFEETYAPRGASWDDYRDSYEYGFAMGRQGHFVNADWDMIQTELRHDWEAHFHGRKWVDYQDAVRAGWHTSREPQ